MIEWITINLDYDSIYKNYRFITTNNDLLLMIDNALLTLIINNIR